MAVVKIGLKSCAFGSAKSFNSHYAPYENEPYVWMGVGFLLVLTASSLRFQIAQP